ncbi:MAG: MCE family protein [Actinomycetota bacterium]|nr:MCE family protein [Actinomycetota bacterium]
MRLNARTVINVLVVFAVGASALVWAVVGLAGLRLFGDERVTVQAVVTRAAGALPGAEVTYLGQSVGTVNRSEFVDDGILLTMDVDLPDEVAAVLRADVRQKSALGEPYVDLGPAQADPDADASEEEVVPLAWSAGRVPAQELDGVRIPRERTSVPAELGQLLSDADALLGDLNPKALGDFVDGSAAIVGNEENLRRILRSGAVVAETIRGRSAEIDSLVANAAQLSETLDASRGDVQGALDGFSELGAVLADRTEQLESILERGSTLATEGSRLIADTRPEVDGVLSGLDATFETLADRPTKVREILTLTPLMIDRFGKTFEGGYFWLGAAHVPFVPGTPRLGVPVTGKGLRIDRIFAPSVAQKITVDLEAMGMPQFGVVQLLPSEQIGAAAQEPGGLSRLIDATRVDLEDEAPEVE